MLTIPTENHVLLRKVARWLLPLIAITAMVLITTMLWRTLVGGQTPTRAVTATVQQGTVVARVAGYGKLFASQSSIVIAQVEGTVEAIESSPGARVEDGQTILRLGSPRLVRALENAEIELLETQSELEAAEARLIREIITLKSEVQLARSEVELASQKLDVLKVLVDERSIAKLDFIEAEIHLRQSQLREQVKQQSLEAFERVREAETRASETRLRKAEKRLEIAMSDLDNLDVRANTTGLLTAFAARIEPGAFVSQGEMIGQIADPTSLYAEIYVSAGDASQVLAGQAVEVNIRGQTVWGQIVRVHPNVEDNQVRADVSLPALLPDAARTNLDVAALITTGRVDGVLAVSTPGNINAGHRDYEIYVRSGDHFERRKIKVGLVSSETMEVVQGLALGEQVLLELPEQNSPTPANMFNG